VVATRKLCHQRATYRISRQFRICVLSRSVHYNLVYTTIREPNQQTLRRPVPFRSAALLQRVFRVAVGRPHCEERNITIDAEAARLEQFKADWLECPQPDLGGRNPAYILECERKRLPLIMSAEETVIDEDCPLCHAMAEEFTPMFCHLDGCNMDNDFPFSFYRTRGEWEQEELRFKQYVDECNEKWKAEGKGF